ncbi:MAG TPA: dicarboxylate/amino acid:cation symporter [bacterium]|nr:dicarboxylate/amino acid:cation symporter [bacterium]
MKGMNRLALHWKILIGMAAGVALGLVLRSWAGPAPQGAAASGIALLDLIGQVFIRLLKMVIIPLIISTMVSGVLSLQSFKKLGRLGLTTFIYYFATTGLAVLTGLILVNLVRPGAGADIGGGKVLDQFAQGLKTWGDLLLGLIPANPVEAMAKMDVLPVITFSLLFGAVLLSLGDRARPLPEIFSALSEAMMRLTDWVLQLAPYGVFALMATLITGFGWGALAKLALYMLTVALGLAIHFFITLPLIALLVGRYSPRRLYRDVSPALMTAFSSASSSATLPLTMENLEKNTGVSRRVTSFVLPIGATVNMDGTALYEAVAAVFIAQAYGVHLTMAQQVLVFATATLAAVGAAAIPSAGLFTMAIVLRAVGLPLEGVALIIGVDRILDMMRTTVNVFGDTVGAVVVARRESENFGAPDTP